MKDWSTLKNAINAVIKTNGNQEITGTVLNSVLNSIVSSLGQNRTFVGVAVPSTNPGAPDGPVFYLAFTKGTYANFAGAKVENNAIILQNTNTTWQAVDTGLKIGSTQDTSYIESCISSLLTDATKVPIVQLQGIILPEDEANDYFNVQDLVGIVYHASRNLITNFANGEFIDDIDQSGYYQGDGVIGMPLSNTIYFVPQITGYAHPGLYWYNGTQLSNITQNLIDHVDGLIEDVNMLQSSVDDLSKPPHNITLTHSSDNNLTTWSGVDIGDIHQGDILTWSDTDETYKAVVISENTVDDLRVIQARFTPSGDEGLSINALYLYSNGSVQEACFLSEDQINEKLKRKQKTLAATTDVVIESETNTTDGLYLTDSAKRAVFNDMFNLAAGSDGGYKPSEAPDPAKPYLLNKLWLSYEEAVKIYAINGADAGRYQPNISRRYSPYNGAPLVNSVRTLFKVCGYTTDYGMFFGATKLEVVNVNISGNLTWVFRGNSKLKTVLGTVEIYAVKSGDILIWDCALLEDVNLKGLRNNIRMLGCPKLSLATMQYLVDNASTAITAEKPVVVTVHADVFAKLTGDMTNEAAAALTDDEKTAWAAVLTAATSKYISFAID